MSGSFARCRFALARDAWYCVESDNVVPAEALGSFQTLTLLQINMEVEKGPKKDYYPLHGILYELPC